ncbi:DNA mismatch repair protein MutS [Candidatus Falkowbacteria bacterium]|nr:DNA mismatch repair protein MutS [Candidatus Falkowbacteria bacterium]
MNDLTPVLRQYWQIKEKHKTELLLFRMGDFYEMLGDDAKIAAPILNIALTARYRETEKETPMCGFPHHAAEQYIAKLTQAGKRVAVCDQVGHPTNPVSGVVDRKVIRIITPGTILDERILERKTNNFIVSIYFKNSRFGVAICDLTTGEFEVGEINELDVLKNELARLSASEFIINGSLANNVDLAVFIASLKNVSIFDLAGFENPRNLLVDHFKVHDLNSFGIDNLDAGIFAAAALLSYLKDTQKNSLTHIIKIRRYALDDRMLLDETAITNLELLFSNSRGSDASLINVIDKTSTAMGARLLRRWLLAPLKNVAAIKQRLNVVADFYKNFSAAKNLAELLTKVSDIERLIGRLGCGRGNARDLLNLKNSLELLPEIKNILGTMENCVAAAAQIIELPEIINLIKSSIKENPPAIINEGGMIANGYDPKLDELRKIAFGGKEWLKDLQQREIEKTGIGSLKVSYNKIFGYYIEISNANLLAVPADYTRKQTLVNAERFVIPELKEYEQKVLTAEIEIKERELRIFNELVEKISARFWEIKEIASAIAQIDVLLGFAILAKENNYCQPMIDDGPADGGVIEIHAGRHPVIEKNQSEPYVPNDLQMDSVENEIILLTGPNMSGKSSYLRQTALIVLLAQIGCFVPAVSARVGIVDRIFTRVGASDNLALGRSTFMVEMQEMANILNNATKRSLIILDELGRGTATYDGLSIAWAVVEYLHEKLQARTLFATHYHELTDLADKFQRIQNFCVAVSESGGRVVFLYKIIKGAASKSYGIEVGRLAGLPNEITERADQILVELEEKSKAKIKKNAAQFELPLGPANGGFKQKSLVEQELVDLDVDNMTPLKALEKIADLKRKIDIEGGGYSQP